MTARQLLGSVRRTAIAAVSQREFSLPGDGPIVSFTFDDFPQSALHVGGAILKDHGARGTYYASMGLMNATNGLGRHFSSEDLQMLLEDAHELGSHTFSHMSGRSSSLYEFEADVLKGKQAMEQIAGSGGAHFSYPFGHVTLRSKARIGKSFSSCRGITAGINERRTDLNLLKANSLYSSSYSAEANSRLLDAAEKATGWAIFYTHDISATPSPFGCTPAEFERVVDSVSKRKLRILPVGQVAGGVPDAQAATASGMTQR